ncbi:3'(2'),5'-bisphosphate nucleotidase CysQ [Gammaproteobacteria bacterium LSUCC0112]|nr:3'(2'),5'-bisphosphate nucleotidase CysQ [Gammaproteobacteria bacterium LSUCC0112]
MQLTRELLQTINQIAVEAGKRIMDVYQRPGLIEVSNKLDESPLTEADLHAHRLILEALTSLTPALPVLSEESAQVPFATRQRWHTYWLVDPLDGTKEFISRNGEFTVNIALISNGEPVMGVVHVPVTGVSYLGICQGTPRAWRCELDNNWTPIRAGTLAEPGPQGSGHLRVVASRRHGGEALEKFLAELNQCYAGMQILNMGSSIKICLIAEGKADVYPRLAATSEWDTAAAHAVLRAAGGDILQADLSQLLYNRKESLLNPVFIAIGKATQKSLNAIQRAIAP